MPSPIVRCRRLLHRHANIVDFLGASLLICLCFIILLPRVHESFQHQPNEEHSHDHNPNQNHEHHHHHQLPIGEVLVCVGFFVFYIIGLSFGGRKDDETNNREKQLLLSSGNERRVSTVCCSSTRCPTDQRDSASLRNFNISPNKSKRSVDELLNDTATMDYDEDECLFTLNNHHNHHTHSRHHEHPAIGVVDNGETTTTRETDKNYGSISMISSKTEIDRISNSPTSTKRYPVAQQITIPTDSMSNDHDTPTDWPLSVKITLFGIALAIILGVLDMNVQGVIEAFKVFKAAATGALIYVTFILILPKGPAGCNACIKEES